MLTGCGSSSSTSTSSTSSQTTSSTASESTFTNPFKDASVGDIVEFGTYEQDNNTSNGKESISWRVLAVEDGKALVLSEKVLDCQKFNSDYTEGDYSKSDLKTWVSSTFKSKAFSSSEKNVISEITCLSASQVKKYISSNTDRVAYPTAYAKAQGVAVGSTGACSWWLTDHVAAKKNNSIRYTLVVGSGGVINDYGEAVTSKDIGVRPAMWVTI